MLFIVKLTISLLIVNSPSCDHCIGGVEWTASEETAAPRGWAIIEALSPETVYEMRVVARSAAGAVESASFIQRVRIGLKRGTSELF